MRRRRRSGEAAELILEALKDRKGSALTYEELCKHTSLPSTTTREGVKALQRKGKVVITKDGHGTSWITQC